MIDLNLKVDRDTYVPNMKLWIHHIVIANSNNIVMERTANAIIVVQKKIYFH